MNFSPPEDEEPLELHPSMLHPEIDFEKGMSYFPLLSVLIGIICIFVFICQVAGGGLESLDKLIAQGALHPGKVGEGEVWRLGSAMFMHGGPDHIMGNLVMLYILGMACEHAFGRAQFIPLYVFAGIIGSLFSLMAGNTSVGASGAIFGLAGGIVVFFWRTRHQLQLRDKRVGVVLAFWAGYQGVLGIMTPGVDNLAHFGGFLGGAVLGLILQPALVSGKEEAASNPVTLGGLIAACACLLLTFVFMIPRLLG